MIKIMRNEKVLTPTLSQGEGAGTCLQNVLLQRKSDQFMNLSIGLLLFSFGNAR